MKHIATLAGLIKRLMLQQMICNESWVQGEMYHHTELKKKKTQKKHQRDQTTIKKKV